MKVKRQYDPEPMDNGSPWMWRRVCTASCFYHRPFWEPDFQDILDASYCLDNMEVK